MIRTLAAFLAAGLLFSACAGSRRNAPEASVSPSTPGNTYAFAPTQGTSADFRWAQLNSSGSFEWKTLSISFVNRAFYEGNRLVYVVDLEILNHGDKPFPWSDYSLYVALPEGEEDWNYRVLFTQSKLAPIPPKKRFRVRYYNQIPGGSVPERFVIVAQDFFGGNDTGFPFYKR